MSAREEGKTLTKKVDSLRRHILRDDEIKALAAHMRKSLGPAFFKVVDEFGLDIEDTLRFQSLACRLTEARLSKGITPKDAATALKVAKYKLDYIEKASLSNINPEITLRYIEFLGLSNWFGRWKKANAELAGRLGLVP